MLIYILPTSTWYVKQRFIQPIVGLSASLELVIYTARRVKIVLKDIRKKRGLSQKRLAESIGMSLQNIQNIEYGEAKSIPLETLEKLCNALDCQVGDLLIHFPKQAANND